MTHPSINSPLRCDFPKCVCLKIWKKHCLGRFPQKQASRDPLFAVVRSPREYSRFSPSVTYRSPSIGRNKLIIGRRLRPRDLGMNYEKRGKLNKNRRFLKTWTTATFHAVYIFLGFTDFTTYVTSFWFATLAFIIHKYILSKNI